MNIDGSCHCEKIAYEATVDPARVGICHCTDCQTLSGSAFRTVALAAIDQFRVTSGDPKIYLKTAASGQKRRQAFCAECGSQIYACADEDPQVVSIRVGTARQRAELVPRFQIWCQSALPWLPTFESTACFDQQPKLG